MFINSQQPNKQLSSVIQRLQKMIKSKFNSEFDFHKITEIPDQYKHLISLINTEKPYSDFASKTIFYPIYIKKRLLGLALITGDNKKDSFPQIEELFDLILKPTLKSMERLEVLVTLQNQLETVNSGVIRIDKYKKTVNHFGPCLIECDNLKDIYRVAMLIHHHTQKDEFLPYSQIKESDFIKIESLGNNTIFIPNISDLKIAQQRALYKYLNSKTKKNNPIIIAGTRSYKALFQSPLFSSDLLQKITQSYFKMHKNFKDYNPIEIIDFFFKT